MVVGSQLTSTNAANQYQKYIANKLAQEYYYSKTFFNIVKMSTIKQGKLSTEQMKYPLIIDISDEYYNQDLKGKTIQIPRYATYPVKNFSEGNDIQPGTLDYDFIEVSVNQKPYVADRISDFVKNSMNINYRPGMPQRMANALNNYVELQIHSLAPNASTKVGNGANDIITHETFYDIKKRFQERNIADLEETPPVVFINPAQALGLIKENDDWIKRGQLGVDYYMKGKITGMIGGCAIAVTTNVPSDGNGGTNALAIVGSQGLYAAVLTKPKMDEYYLPWKKATQIDMIMEEGMSIGDDRHVMWLNKDADSF